MKTIHQIARILAAVFLTLGPTVAAAAPGALDTTFGHGGYVLFPHETYAANDIQIQPNGSILISGITAGAANSIGGFSVVRFLADGRVDGSFGTGGLATAHFNAGINSANSVAIQADGKILAAGNTVADGPPKPRAMAIARFMRNGSLDPAFGFEGTDQLVLSGSTNSRAFVDLLLPNGKILIGGDATFSTGNTGVIVRLNQNGSVDTTFGAAGVALTASTFPVTGIGVQEDGKIVALTGTTAIRFLRNGTVDTEQTRGTLVSQAHFGASMLTPSEKILKALGVHDSQSGNDMDTQAFRLFPDGTNDPTFFSPIFDFLSSVGDNFQNDPYGIAQQGDGSVLIAGSGQNTNAVFEGALARLLRSGPLDQSFGQNGIVTSVLDGNDQFSTVALQSDGRVLAAGLSLVNADLVVARYLSR